MESVGQDSWKAVSTLLVALAFGGHLLLVSPAQADSADDVRQDGAGFESVVDPAEALFALPEPWAQLAEKGGDPEESLNVVLRLDHDVPIGDGRTLRLHELFTLRSWLQWPKRAVLFLVSPALTASQWEIPVEGYNGPEMAARRGMIAFTIDYIGVGDNYVSGKNAVDSTYERNLEALRSVIRYIRYFRAVPRIDLVGESWGGVLALQLSADSTRIRTCVMASMTYKTLADPEFLTPQFVAFLKTLKDNYVPAMPDLIVPMMAGAPEEVVAFVRGKQTGPRLLTPLSQMIEGLPYYDPSVAKVPGLVISGSSEAADSRLLAADYGPDGAEFFEIDGGGHAPRLTSPEAVSAFWSRVFEFLERH